MKPFAEMAKKKLQELRKQLHIQYEEFQGKGLRLDMSRGKPSAERLDLSTGMMDVLNSKDDLICDDGMSCRNYGVLDDIEEAQELLADMMEVAPDHTIIYGNSSLNVMYGTVTRPMTSGVMRNTPWGKLDKVKFLYPAPRCDRHFAITEYLGIEVVNVLMTSAGPDMDIVEGLVANDDTIKDIWCVSKYSNPQDISYSNGTIRRFACLKPAAPDFRIYWDNAHTIHHLYDHDQDHLIEILAGCKGVGNPDVVYRFASTSKVSFLGSGIVAITASQNNPEDIKRQVKIQTIDHDKVNQLRHMGFFGDIHGMVEHMRRHADIMRPKFEAVISILERELGGPGIGTWASPKDGYFISFDPLDGYAKAITTRCKKTGLVTTSAGATYPYGKDLHDSNTRIAPSYPPLLDLMLVMKLFALRAKIVNTDKLLAEMNDQQWGN